MDMISIGIFAAVVIFSAATKVNCGILSIVAAVFLACAAGISERIVLEGVNVDILVTLSGIYLFGECMTESGTLDLFSRKLLARIHVGPRIWPLVSFVFTAAFVMIGPTTMLALSLVPLITIQIAGLIGANPICTMWLTLFGGLSTRLTPLGANSAERIALAGTYGFSGDLKAVLFWDNFIVCAILGLVFYVITGGFRTGKQLVDKVELLEDIPPFTKKQKICLGTMFAFILFYAATGWNIGITALPFVLLMVLTKCVDEKEIIRKTQWSTIIMVVGTGVLANLVQELGGITILSSLIAKISSLETVASVYTALTGVLSMFTHALSVSIPVSLATVKETVGCMGGTYADMVRCVACICTGAYVGMTCPMSLAGANVMGCWSAVVRPSSVEANQHFTKQLLLALVATLLAAAINFIGFPYLFI